MAIREAAPLQDIDEDQLRATPEKYAVGGIPAVAVPMDRAIRSTGLTRAVRTSPQAQPADSIDGQGCARPEGTAVRLFAGIHSDRRLGVGRDGRGADVLAVAHQWAKAQEPPR